MTSGKERVSRWGVVSNLCNSQIPTLQLGDRCADNDLDKANMLNNHCFNTSLPPLSGLFESAEHMDLLEREAKNISYALRRMFCIFCNKKNDASKAY